MLRDDDNTLSFSQSSSSVSRYLFRALIKTNLPLLSGGKVIFSPLQTSLSCYLLKVHNAAWISICRLSIYAILHTNKLFVLSDGTSAVHNRNVTLHVAICPLSTTTTRARQINQTYQNYLSFATPGGSSSMKSFFGPALAGSPMLHGVGPNPTKTRFILKHKLRTLQYLRAHGILQNSIRPSQ